MSKLIYRIRKVKSLLGRREELQHQHIYFATPSKLNDPMEGFRDLVWIGDEIIWRNLFQHYVSTFHSTYVLATLGAHSHPISAEEIPIERRLYSELSSKGRAILGEILEVVFKACQLQQLSFELGKTDHKARRDELLLYLYTIHPVALREIQRIHLRHGLPVIEIGAIEKVALPSNPVKIPSLLREIPEKNSNLIASDVANMLSVVGRVLEDQKLINTYKLQAPPRKKPNAAQSNRELLLLEFPKTYLSELNRILYPAWYVACFMEDYRNSSVWGHYGENHTGACLIFAAEDVGGFPGLRLNKGTAGSRTPNEETNPPQNNRLENRHALRFHKVNYKSRTKEIDFFRSIGALPMPTLMSDWYTDLDGNKSTCSSHVRAGQEQEWRDAYWQRFYRDISRKSKDWSYEKETRLILNQLTGSMPEPSSRILTYDFRSLKGVIFGISMRQGDKLEIMRIVLEKCRTADRSDFEFYQAYFDHEHNQIEKHKLRIDLHGSAP